MMLDWSGFSVASVNLDAAIPSAIRGKYVWGVWFEGRRTPVVVGAASRAEAIERARPRMQRGGKAVSSVRRLKGPDLAAANRGEWVRTGPQGQKAGFKGMRGQGPPPGGY